jgi:multiple antibiotic resistance protein
MSTVLTLFVSTFSTLLAIINPLEALPVFLLLLQGQDDAAHRKVAQRASLYTLGLLFFFLIFGTLIMRVFGVSLSMVRVIGGIILIRIGFELFSGSSSKVGIASNRQGGDMDIAFMPLAMPLMCGPGAIATMLGMTAMIRHEELEIASFLAVAAAIVSTMIVTYFCLAYAKKVVGRIGPMGIDAVTRIVGFFVAAIGGGLVFTGILQALHEHGVIATGG